MHTVKSGFWCLKGGERGDGVTLNLRPLAVDARACPPADVLVHTWPDIPLGDEALSCSYARVGE